MVECFEKHSREEKQREKKEKKEKKREKREENSLIKSRLISIYHRLEGADMNTTYSVK